MAENVSGLARALGRHRNTVSEWLRTGCPGDVAGAVGWLEDRAAERARAPLLERIATLEAALGGAAEGVSESEWRRRKRAAEAALLELALATKRGEYVAGGDVDLFVMRLCGGMAQRINAIPSKAAPEVRAAASDAEAEALLTGFVHEALTEIADAMSEAGARACAAAEGADR